MRGHLRASCSNASARSSVTSSATYRRRWQRAVTRDLRGDLPGRTSSTGASIRPRRSRRSHYEDVCVVHRRTIPARDSCHRDQRRGRRLPGCRRRWRSTLALSRAGSAVARGLPIQRHLSWVDREAARCRRRANAARDVAAAADGIAGVPATRARVAAHRQRPRGLRVLVSLGTLGVVADLRRETSAGAAR